MSNPHADAIAYENLIGTGGSRDVYALGDGTVLKVDSNPDEGIGNCQTEAAVWAAVAGTPDADLFAPVLAHGAGWLVMAEADCDRFSAADADAWISAHYDRLIALGVDDITIHNVGRIGGRFVVVDYAYPVDLCDCKFCPDCEARWEAAHKAA